MGKDTPLEIREASKWFGDFCAVDSLNLTVEAGDIVGFLGPNGAGKSTSLRMALGVLAPDQGQVALYGKPPDLATLRRVGFLPEERGLYKRMTARQIITYFARLKGLGHRAARTRADDLLEALGLQAFGRHKISRLSKGMAQKVQILTALAHQPDFLILDEPFSGLDPVNQQALESLIVSEHQRGATVIFSTHVMEHAERLCETIVMMAQGRKVFDGPLQAALRTVRRSVRIEVSEGFDLAACLAQHGFRAHADDGIWRVGLAADQDPQDILRAAIGAGAPITSFQPEGARLRDVFVSLVSAPEADDVLSQKREPDYAGGGVS
ncbi:MAG: ABC transporter ATP-binding protein [Henriciella sp.]|jgi:ABC-2 type transport system ATP-binding protein